MGPRGVQPRDAVLDLGSGIGTVGMICAWRLPGRKIRHRRGAGGERGAGEKIRSAITA